jgi:protein kinase C substrate 80K-H
LAHQAAEARLRESRKRLEEDTAALKKLFDPEIGYGKSGEWRKLQDTCIEKDAGECVLLNATLLESSRESARRTYGCVTNRYKYEVCFFGSATQKAKGGGGNHNLGYG